ncbi:hypothetical protein Tco_1106700 [Tanacetum coccineum]
MSNTNNNLKTQTSNALHNAIMEAGGKDRPPMLAPGNYVQWKSIIKRYINTNLTMNSSTIVSRIYLTNSNGLKRVFQLQKIILTRIDNDIYSTINACPNACEMWKAIESLKQGESINVQDLKINLYWEFGKFTSRDGESLKSYCSRLYKMMNELVRNQCDSQQLKTVSYHKLYDILKQHHNQVNKIRAERLAPATRNRGKAIVNSLPPTYDQEPEMVAEDDALSKENEIDKLMDFISLSFKKIYKPTNNNLGTSSNTIQQFKIIL